MTLIDDLSEPLTPADLYRRKLLALLGSGALGTAVAGTLVTAVRYLSPAVLYEASSRLVVGPLENIPIGSVLSFPQKKVYVLRSDEGVFALSSTCTHLGCMTHWEPEHGRVFCPCHGSQFDRSGQVTGGPAPRPLPRLAVLLEDGVIVVDTRSEAPAEAILKV